ncbi:MAG: sulfite exporter TauE/SafE family protein [Nitrospirae bacterium]|nr:sulfite exporter TauE/SafE family protein [Nitrospirota bacterium]
MLTRDSLYLLMFGSGLLGGIGHCSGMCGPIVAAYSLHLRPSGTEGKPYTSLPHLFYNAGRITTYSIIGGLMGLTGSFANIVQAIEKFQAIAMAGIGAVMILIGVATSGLFSFGRQSAISPGSKSIAAAVTDAVRRGISFIAETQTSGSFYVMGMATGFIPCGLLYTAYIAAAGAGAGSGSQTEGFLKGMLMLFFFGIGTAPSLFLIGRIAVLKREWIRKRFYRISSLFMIIIGAMLIYRSFRY